MYKHPLALFFLVLAFFFILTLALHHKAFDAPMYYDSAARLQQNEHVFARGFSDTLAIFPQRPIPMASFYLNYLTGGINPFYFRVVNAFIMALAASVLVVVLILILEIPGVADNRSARDKFILSLLLGTLFVVHPLQTYLVVYIWQRMALLSCFFYLAALAAYVATRTGRIGRKTLGYGLCLIMFFCGLASKENAVTLPAVLILAEIAFFENRMSTLFRRAFVYVATLVVFSTVLSLLERPHGVGDAVGTLETISRYYRESGLSVAQVAVFQCKVMFEYLAMILLPTPLRVRLFSPQVLPESALTDPLNVAAVLGVLIYVGAGAYLLRKRPLSGFGLLFFLANLLPESFLVPQYLFLGYRAVLPMVGLALVAADGVIYILGKASAPKKGFAVRVALAACFGAAASFMACVTVSKAGAWIDPGLFWGEVVDHLPADAKTLERHPTRQALNSLAMHLQKIGKLDQAMALHLRALQCDPHYYSTFVFMAHGFVRAGDLVQAEFYANKAIEINPKSSEAHDALGRILLKNGKLDGAVEHFRRSVAIESDSSEYHYQLARALSQKGDQTGAANHFRMAAKLNPLFYDARYNLGKTLLLSGQTDQALAELSKTTEIKPDHWQAHNDVGVLLARSGRLAEAVEHFRKALIIKPDDIPSKRNLETALDQMKSSPAH